MSIEPGTLYVVATPIGNLGDIGRRALEVLGAVDLIAAEDTRHSGVLLSRYGIRVPMLALHEHNEVAASARVLERIRRGESVALISDAGTPLISDPGYRLVRAARDGGLVVVPVPGPSALVCALSAAGMPTDRFVFEGFLPRTRAARRSRLEALRGELRTLVFYEAKHRILDTLDDLIAVFGAEREATVAREMTKAFESFRSGSLAELAGWLRQAEERRRGEFVLVVAGTEVSAPGTPTPAVLRTLRILGEELPLRQAARLTARITGGKPNRLYDEALRLSGEAARDANNGSAGED